MAFLVEHRITPFVRAWLTTTSKVLKPEDGGRSVIRLQEICWKGWDAREQIGESGGVGVCLGLLAGSTAFHVLMDKVSEAG